jgi:transposase
MILFEKFGQHQPLNRQSERYAQEGIDLSVSTLADQVGACTAVMIKAKGIKQKAHAATTADVAATTIVGFAGPNLLAMILFEKFGQHQPLNRQSEVPCRRSMPPAIKDIADRLDGKPAQMVTYEGDDHQPVTAIVREIVHLPPGGVQLDMEPADEPADEPLTTFGRANGGNGQPS